MVLPNKLNMYSKWVYFLFMGYLYLFWLYFFCVEFDKMRIPYTIKYSHIPISVYSLFGDDLEFAFLCADSGRRTFYFY